MFKYNIFNAQSLQPFWLSRLDRVIIFVTDESELTRSSHIDDMHFFFNLREISVALFSRNRRFFELLHSLLVTRLKKIIKMPVIWKFSEG